MGPCAVERAGRAYRVPVSAGRAAADDATVTARATGSRRAAVTLVAVASPRRDASGAGHCRPARARSVETIPAPRCYATSPPRPRSTLRAAEAGGLGGRAVGARAVRDALLDHVPIVVSARRASGSTCRSGSSKRWYGWTSWPRRRGSRRRTGSGGPSRTVDRPRRRLRHCLVARGESPCRATRSGSGRLSCRHDVNRRAGVGRSTKRAGG